MRLNELTRPKSIIQDITSNCKQILSLYASFPGRYFYRGSKRSGSIYKGNSYQNRIPKDTDLAIHKLVVDAMIDLGFAAHRGNSIFMTGSRNTAKEFSSPILGGQIYIIFPIDGFHYSWSSQVDDFYSDVIETADIVFGTDYKDILEILVNLDYKDTDLDKALKFSNSAEVMVHGSYYAINSSYEKQVNAFIQGLK